MAGRGLRLRRKRIPPADQIVLKMLLDVAETRVILKRASRQDLLPFRTFTESVIA
jgi:hypothetical protein